jgi:hypothetical protein
MLAGLISLWILGQKLRDPGGYVSSDVRYMEIRSMVRYLAGPARAAGRDDSAQRDLSKRIRGFGNQNINGIVTRQGGGQFEIRLQFGREILQGMDRDIDLSAQ